MRVLKIIKHVHNLVADFSEHTHALALEFVEDKKMAFGAVFATIVAAVHGVSSGTLYYAGMNGNCYIE